MVLDIARDAGSAGGVSAVAWRNVAGARRLLLIGVLGELAEGLGMM